MTWEPETREKFHKQFGDYRLIPERNKQGETAHLVDLGDRKIRVLPDGSHSGQKRATVVRRALETLAALNGVSGDVAESYFVGSVAREDLSWEYVTHDDLRDVTIEEWLEHYFHEHAADPVYMTNHFQPDLKADGWAIVREDYLRDLEDA